MKTIFAILSSLTLVVSANAATIITPNTPTGNVAPNAGSSYASLVNSSGLSSIVTAGMDTATALAVTQSAATADTYVTPASGSDYFVSGTTPVLTFDLGGTFDDINSIVLWNYHLTQNDTTQFSLSFYSDALATTQLGSTITGLTALADATNAQQIFFGGGGTLEIDGVRAIQMTLTDNNGGNRVGLGEIRFSQTPEPSRVVLLGLASFGLFLRRRR